MDGEKSVVQSSEDKTIRVWDLRSCTVAQQMKPKQHIQASDLEGGRRGWRECRKVGEGRVGRTLNTQTERVHRRKEYPPAVKHTVLNQTFLHLVIALVPRLSP